MRLPLLALTGCALAASPVFVSAAAASYQVVQTAKVGGDGSFDYVYADATERRLYIPRGDRVTVFNLDTLAPAGTIPEAKGVRGTAIDPKSHHGFCSSNPVVMWDSATLEVIKRIPVEGAPDGILFEPATQRVFVFSHRAPHATVLDARDGTIVGTMDLGGAPEQAVSDGRGKIFVDIEDKDNVAVVDAKALKVLAHYELGDKGGTPAGLAFDVKNHVLFVCCRKPANMVMMNSDDGKIIATVPIGAGTDGGLFNPATMEAFSSNRDGTLTVIKETSPTTFEVTQTVATKTGAKTCTLDSKTNRVLLIAADMAPPPAPPPDQPGAAKAKAPRAQMVPGSFTILAVGK